MIAKRAKLSRRRVARPRSATLTYALPEEREALDEALAAPDLARVIRDYDQWLRGLAKHSDVDHEWAQKARDRLHEEIREAGVGDAVWR